MRKVIFILTMLAAGNIMAATNTATNTTTATNTVTATTTNTNTLTNTNTATLTATFTATATATATKTFTNTTTFSATFTKTNTKTATQTYTVTQTPVPINPSKTRPNVVYPVAQPVDNLNYMLGLSNNPLSVSVNGTSLTYSATIGTVNQGNKGTVGQSWYIQPANQTEAVTNKTTIAAGTITATASTSVQLLTLITIPYGKSLVVTALAVNGSPIYVCGSAVNFGSPFGNYWLYPGKSITILDINSANLYFGIVSSGDGITWYVEQ